MLLNEEVDMSNIPQLFLPLTQDFKKYTNRYFGGGKRDRGEVKDLLPYYLSLQGLHEFVSKEIEAIEQSLFDMYTENGHETEYLEGMGLKVKLLKEHGKVFDVSKIIKRDKAEICRRKLEN